MARAAQQRRLGAFGLQGAARVAHVLEAEPVGQHHHHAGGGGLQVVLVVHAQRAAAPHGGQQGAHGGHLGLQHAGELRLQQAVARQQVVQVAVEKAVLPEQLEQPVHEEPRVLHVGRIAAGLQQPAQGLVVLCEQRIDDLVLGAVVVIEVAGADAQLSGNGGGGDMGLAKAVEQRQAGLENALGGAAGGLACHGPSPPIDGDGRGVAVC
ncbi:Inner membrane transporter rhtA [Alicycliphilus sp. B1]|nr:Inner membrane transporter rhtA [Alicycliphilus sp. B1]